MAFCCKFSYVATTANQSYPGTVKVRKYSVYIQHKPGMQNFHLLAICALLKKVCRPSLEVYVQSSMLLFVCFCLVVLGCDLGPPNRNKQTLCWVLFLTQPSQLTVVNCDGCVRNRTQHKVSISLQYFLADVY